MAVLPAGFTPTEESPFPAEHLDAFIAEFSKRAERAKIAGADLASLQPDCLSLASLAKSMGITEAELLALMSEKGIQPKVQVVLDARDIAKFRP
jgi:3-mercaptopyruvate sulfurtransferase SseA